MSDNNDPMRYTVAAGTVQPYIRRIGDKSAPLFTHHFGFAQYDRRRMVLTPYLRERGQKVCDMLNAGQINEDEARRLLR